jgi:hypothetical protein
MNSLKLREIIFDSKTEKKFFDFWERFFSIKEIEESRALLWVFGATIFSYFVAFSKWMYSGALTKQTFSSGNSACRPYYQDCGQWHILEALPYGYSQMTLYMFFFALMVLSVFLLYKKDYVLAQIVMVPIFLWHFLAVFVLTESFSANYEYYLFIFGFTLLFLPHKEFFLKLFLVLFYFFSTTIKMHQGWVLGTYFSAMKTGLPIFPDWSIAIITNITIAMQMIFVWFVFSKNKIMRNWAVFFFAFFHLYSGILVGYRYPSVVLPTFLILYVLYYRYQEIPVDRKSIVCWVVAAILFCLQFISILIPGDEKLTLEGNKYGLYMFEANHQCVSEFSLVYADGSTRQKKTESESARNRCDPYRAWFRTKNKYCNRDGIKNISWKFDHSINGGPFLRIVDQENICNLEYKAFEHNKWIKTEKNNPEIMGYPVENWYK